MFSQSMMREHNPHHSSPMHREGMYPYPASPRGPGPSPSTYSHNPEWSTRNGVAASGSYYTANGSGSLSSPAAQYGPQSSEDAKYWNHMFRELGLGLEGLDQTGPMLGAGYSMSSSIGTGAGPMPLPMNSTMSMSSSHNGHGGGQVNVMGPGASSSTPSPSSGYVSAGGGHPRANYGLQTQYPPYHSVADGGYGI